jgi:hypothetical protein
MFEQPWRDDEGGKAAFFPVNPSVTANHPLGLTPMRKVIRIPPDSRRENEDR